MRGVDWRKRDRMIVSTIELFRFVTANHIYRMFFANQKYGEIKARARLRALTKQGRINMNKINKVNVYYTEQWSKNFAHWLMIAEAYIKLKEQQKSWEELKVYTEFQLCNLRSDLFLLISNKVTHKWTTVAIEVDRGTNEFTKVDDYNRLFESDEWVNQWWAKQGDTARFPKIIVFTTRPDTVQKMIEKENRNNLRWEVWRCEDSFV